MRTLMMGLVMAVAFPTLAMAGAIRLYMVTNAQVVLISTYANYPDCSTHALQSHVENPPGSTAVPVVFVCVAD